jgi:glycosyltransferase involved in cell wall biosynthesis
MHGSPARAYAYKYITGDYVLYLDDDDYWINDTLAVLAKAVEDANYPDWGVFPARRWDGRFFNPKPGDCATTSCQFFHKPVIKGVEIRWIPYNISSPDGKLVQGLTYLSEPLMVDGPELVVQESQLFGRRPEDDPATYKKW